MLERIFDAMTSPRPNKQQTKTRAEDRAALGQRLGDAARLASNAADLFDERVAAFVGINRTDARCVDLIDYHGRLTAGDLAQAASLTTGAVTTALDRLERAGLVLRERSEQDRRKVYVALTPHGTRLLRALYTPYKAAWIKQGKTFSDEALAQVAHYLEIARRMSLSYADAVRALELSPDASLAERVAAAETLSDWSLPPERERESD